MYTSFFKREKRNKNKTVARTRMIENKNYNYQSFFKREKRNKNKTVARAHLNENTNYNYYKRYFFPNQEVTIQAIQ